MKIRKTVILIICVAAMIICTACSRTIPQTNFEENNSNNTQINESSNEKNTEEQVSSASGEELENRFVRASEFSDGYAFVMANTEDRRFYCINTTGEVVFELPAVYVVSAGFANGIAMLSDQTSGSAILCDEKGNLTTAEDLNATEILFTDPEAFADGYILVKRTTTNYQGSVDELSVLNSKLETVVEYSSELYEHAESIGSRYVNGYLYEAEYGEFLRYLDLRTGKYYEDGSDLGTKINLENKSDIWYQGGTIYAPCYKDPCQNGETVIDLSEYGTSVSCNDFSSGLAPLFFMVDESSGGQKMFFTWLKEDGTFCFEPEEIQWSSWCYDSGCAVFIREEFRMNGEKIEGTDLHIAKYDQTGKVTETSISLESGKTAKTACELNDGYILIEIVYSSGERVWTYYTLDLKPAF